MPHQTLILGTTTGARIPRHIITTRKSIFPPECSDTSIAEEVLKETISSADYAPSHKRTRPWRLKAHRSTGKALLGEELVRLHKENVPAENFSKRRMNETIQKTAKSSTIVTISICFSGKVPEWEEIAATVMAVQNIYPTCTAHGIECYQDTPGFMFQMKDFLQLEENERCYRFFSMEIKK